MPSQPPAVQPIDRLLAKNIVAARCALGWTQEALSAASGISRATIAQLETGSSDPRLSTIEALAKALHLTTALLLFGQREIDGLGSLQTAERPIDSLASPRFLRTLEMQLESASVKDAAKAAELVRELLEASPEFNEASLLLAAVFGIHRPDPGLALGARLGKHF